MSELYSDDNGNRVIVRHKGPPGKGLPPGGTEGQILVKDSIADFDTHWANAPEGTDAAVGPASSLNGTFALFDGTTGKLLKDSTFSTSYFATKSYADTKQAAVSGKGLSEEDFTTVLKDKLDALDPSGFRGSFLDETEIAAFTFDPPPVAGDYCLIEVETEAIQLVLWDESNVVWTPLVPDAVAMTGAEIADVLFNETEVWDQETCRIFTTIERGQIAAHESTLSALGLGAVAPAYGSVNYFSLTPGTLQTLTVNSDGVSNVSKITASTVLSGEVQNFDNGGASNGRLRYIGAAPTVFQVRIDLTLECTHVGDFVVAIAKNNSIIPETRQLTAINTSNDIENVSISGIVALLNNEYLEAFIGRTSGTANPIVHAISISAVKIA